MKVTAVLQRYARWMPGGVSFLLALLFALTPFWYLVLLAGVAGGWFTRKMRWGALSAALGVSPLRGCSIFWYRADGPFSSRLAG